MDTSPASAPRAHESVVVSPEMTILIGRGPIGEAAVPADALAIAYGMGAINAPATLTLVGRDQVPALLAEDAGATRVVLLVAPNALNRSGGQTRPDVGERRGFHLPSELRGIGLALRDCGLSGEAGDIYRAARRSNCCSRPGACWTPRCCRRSPARALCPRPTACVWPRPA